MVGFVNFRKSIVYAINFAIKIRGKSVNIHAVMYIVHSYSGRRSPLPGDFVPIGSIVFQPGITGHY